MRFFGIISQFSVSDKPFILRVLVHAAKIANQHFAVSSLAKQI